MKRLTRKKRAQIYRMYAAINSMGMVTHDRNYANIDFPELNLFYIPMQERLLYGLIIPENEVRGIRVTMYLLAEQIALNSIYK